MADLLSALFDTDGTPLNGKVRRAPGGGSCFEVASITGTPAEDAADFSSVIPVPVGATLKHLFWEVGDFDVHATETIDMDIILRKVVSGSNVDTILYNAGTAFEDAATSSKLLNQAVTETDTGYAIVGFLCNTAAATDASATATLGLTWD